MPRYGRNSGKTGSNSSANVQLIFVGFSFVTPNSNLTPSTCLHVKQTRRIL